MKMRIGRRKGSVVVIWISTIVLILAALCVFDPSTRKTFSPYMYSEGEGRRQYDYKYLGFLPYSRTEFVDGLHTEDDVARHLESDGITLPPGFEVDSPNATAMRDFYDMGTSSTLNFNDVPDPRSLYTFFKSQVSSPTTDTNNADGTWELAWRSPNGRDSVRIGVYVAYERGTKTPIPKSHWLQVRIQPWLRPGTVLK
jgi:hypothetical protein